jgi:hypothetical protein
LKTYYTVKHNFSYYIYRIGKGRWEIGRWRKRIERKTGRGMERMPQQSCRVEKQYITYAHLYFYEYVYIHILNLYKYRTYIYILYVHHEIGTRALKKGPKIHGQNGKEEELKDIIAKA